MAGTIAARGDRRPAGYRARPMRLRGLRRSGLAALAVITALLAPPAIAQAQQSPFTPLPSAPAETQTQTTAFTTTDDGGIDSGLAFLIVLGGVALLTAVAFFIIRDARRRAPKEAPNPFVSETVAADAHRSAKDAKRKARAKSKAARAQRRRNR
jgi:hypothetical protein